MPFGEHTTRGPTTSAERHAAINARHSQVERQACADPKRRARLEADSESWLRWYCPNAFYLPMEKPHQAIIAGAEEAHKTGGRLVVAAERGIGKSTILYGMVIKLALSGEQIFPVYIPWGDKDKGQGFEFWLNCLVHNDRIHADYPEITGPFRHAEGVAQRINTTTWQDTGKPTHARSQISKGVIVFPDGRGYIGSSTMNGNPRGLNATMPDGEIIRPSMALIDDVQDDKVAVSQGAQGLVVKTIRKINGSIAGLKRAGGVFPILMSGNCIVAGDVMDHFLNQIGWDAVRIACVEQWPAGWDDPKTKTGALWEECGERFLSKRGDVTFYRKHRAQIHKGMILTSPKAYMQSITEAAKDKRRNISKPVDAYHGVLREFFTMGREAFMAERQQAPEVQQSSIYILTPELIQTRADQNRAPGIVPDWAHTVLACTDVNYSYALTTAIVAFGANQNAAVLWYGLYKSAPLPVRKNEAVIEQRRKIYEALAAHGKELAALPCRPNTWIIDGGGSPEGTVIDLAHNAPQICGLQAWCAFGRGWRQYRPTSKATHKVHVGEQLHRVVERRDRQWLIFNADYWREVAQRGWTGQPGAPGSCSLPKGKHLDFASQICREQLRGKDEVGGKTVWVWNTAPGPHDYGDCMTMAYMGAAFSGIGTGGQVQPKKQQRKREGVTVIPL